MPEEQKDNAGKRKPSLTGLAAKLGRLPAEKRKVALEMSASLAAVSLKASRAFVEAVPKASKLLSVDDLRDWAELGRRLAMADPDMAVEYFESGTDKLKKARSRGERTRVPDSHKTASAFQLDRVRDLRKDSGACRQGRGQAAFHCDTVAGKRDREQVRQTQFGFSGRNP